jgi:hypothetical protein
MVAGRGSPPRGRGLGRGHVGCGAAPLRDDDLNYERDEITKPAPQPWAGYDLAASPCQSHPILYVLDFVNQTPNSCRPCLTLGHSPSRPEPPARHPTASCDPVWMRLADGGFSWMSVTDFDRGRQVQNQGPGKACNLSDLASTMSVLIVSGSPGGGSDLFQGVVW